MAATTEQEASNPEIAVIGGGIAGGALAAVAARAGLRVLLLERTIKHEDRVRGEFMPPWGVQEAQKLGVLDDFLKAGSNWVRRSVGYGEDIAPPAAEAKAIHLDALLPGVAGALTFGHPQMCTAFNDAAVTAGAVLIRGVSDLEVSPGSPPTLTFRHADQRSTIRPRLIVAADGRGSRSARAIGAQVHSEEVDHLLCGLLVDGVHGWPADQMTIGTEGDLFFYVFPQGGGRARLYAGYSKLQVGRFSGAGSAERLLKAFEFGSVPGSDELASARAIGPCHGYPAGDTWLEAVGADGVVLVGDAAGHNCPCVGQGVSIALRDARHVLEGVLNGGWSPATLGAYAAERTERLRRLRFVAQLFRALRADFSPEGRARRQRVRERAAVDPTLMLPFVATQAGPYAVPAETFTQATRERLLQ